jgi:uroporphyrinogen-III synthase
MSVLVWTRALAEWAEDELKLWQVALGPSVQVVRLPCIRVEPLAATLPDERPFEAAVLTSASALRHAPRPLREAIQGCQRVFTHGDKTAEAARAAGITTIEKEAVRTAKELAAHVLRELAPGSRVLVPTAEEPAFDMAGTLTAAGLEAFAVATYRTHAEARRQDGGQLDPEEIAAATRDWSGVVCFTSPSAVRAFTAAFAPASNRLKEALTAVAVGPTTAEVCRGQFAVVRASAANAVETLLQTAKEELDRSA